MVQKSTNQPSILFTIACVYYLADMLLPVLQYWSSVYINILMISILLGSIFAHNNKKTFRFFAPFILIVSFQLISGLLKAEGLRAILLSFYSAILFILPLILSFYLIVNNYQKTIKLLLIVSIVGLFITSITSVIGLIADPLASKEMATGMTGDPKLMVYYAQNIGGFGIVYMIPIVIPMIAALVNKSRLNMFNAAVILIPMIYFVYVSQYAIAILSLIIALGSIVFARNYSRIKFISVGIIVLVFFLFLRPVIGSLFYYIAANNTSMDISVRFNALGDTMMGIESTKDVYVLRQEAYNRSIDAFFSSPFIGSLMPGTKQAGGHSFLLDITASFGLAGIIALFLAYRQIIRFFYSPYKVQSYYGYMLWSFFLSIFLSVFNTSANIFAIGFFVPLVAYSIQINKSMNHPLLPRSNINKNNQS